MNRVSTKQASIELGCSEQYLRLLMQSGLAPIGVIKKNGTRNSYVILRDRLDKFIQGGN